MSLFTNDWLFTESGVRLGFFLGILGLMAVFEFVSPRRALVGRKPLRWASNLALAALNIMLLRLLVPLGATGVAAIAEARHWGLFHYLPGPRIVKAAAGVLLLDLAIYGQHVMFHAVPWLWRLHLVHHVDRDVDVTTGLRFHSVEILLSFVWKCLVIVALGISPLAVLVFEVLLNGLAMFNHANVRLPNWLDRAARRVVVTPDMHRVHHSVLAEETNSNFGFNLVWWDWLFRTYRDQPAEGHTEMRLGQARFRDDRYERLPRMLWLPFSPDASPRADPPSPGDGSSA